MAMKSEAAEGKLWTVHVVFANGQPRCKESVRAGSGLEALEKIRKRYPFVDMARTTVAQEGEAVVKPLLTLPVQQKPLKEELQKPEDDGLEQVPFDVLVEEMGYDPKLMRIDPVPFAVEVEEELEPEPIAQDVGDAPLDQERTARNRRVVHRAQTGADAMEITPSEELHQEWLRRRQQAIEAMMPTHQERAQEPPAEIDRPGADRELFIPSAKRCEPSPAAPEPRPGLVVGPKDSQGRRTILEDTARAAALLHARGEATWDQMAAHLGVNTDHLRKRCRRHYPAIDQKDGQPGQKSAQVNRRMILTWVPVSTLRPVDAWYPVLACRPGEQWQVRPYGNRVELEKEGFLWAIRLGNLPRPES